MEHVAKTKRLWFQQKLEIGTLPCGVRAIGSSSVSYFHVVMLYPDRMARTGPSMDCSDCVGCIALLLLGEIAAMVDDKYSLHSLCRNAGASLKGGVGDCVRNRI